ncbi:MAG: S-layer homology domain-containing protein, partial [bacterium]|nr:S-layer homology domain-containing protein [bacterium]
APPDTAPAPTPAPSPSAPPTTAQLPAASSIPGRFPASSFSDITSTPFTDQINWMAARGISSGWKENGETTYRPFQPVLRDAMAAFLYRLAGRPAITIPNASPFIDVPHGRAFFEDIVWMSQTGVSTGWIHANQSATFQPDTPVLRDAMAAFLYRAAGSPAFTPPRTSPFHDVPTNRVFYKEIAWMHHAGISTGWIENGRTEYRPNEPVLRDAMAAFLYRFDQAGHRINLRASLPPQPAYTVNGAISTSWNNAGGARALGSPTGPEMCDNTGGCHQWFGPNLIMWSPSNGAHILRGAILNAYAAQGHHHGRLGFPTGQRGSRDGVTFQGFTGGVIVVRDSSGAVEVSHGDFAAHGTMPWPSDRPTSYSGRHSSINGTIDDELCTIPWMTTHRLHCRTIVDTAALNWAYQDRFGTNLPIDTWRESAYRTFADQQYVWRTIGPPIAARVGTSPHGWGQAIDFFEHFGYSTAENQWLDRNGPTYGWDRRPWHDPDGSYGEWWHFDYVR